MDASLANIFNRVGSKKQRAIFNAAFDNLIAKINFASEAESIRPENVEITKQAFIEFMHQVGAPLANWSFEALLEEKSGKDEFRADGHTPNWYHEFRNVLNNMSKVRCGLVHYKDIQTYGGIDVFISSILRHDSWEDFGKSPLAIASYYSEKIKSAPIDDHRKIQLYDQVSSIAHIVDLTTRKTPQLDDNGEFVLKPTGKIVKIDRFDGDLNIYFDHLLQHPFACLIKFEDANEGMSTRIGVVNFSVDDDRKYTAERRALFGARPFDDESIEAYPFLKQSIRNADSMLGILLKEMETQIYYVREQGKTYQNPIYARPLSITEYIPYARAGYDRLPPAWHPQTIFLERMENKAAKEMDAHTRDLLDYAIYPALNGHFPKPENFVPSLPEGPFRDHTMQ